MYDQHATTNFMPFDEKAAMASKPDQSVIAKQVKASHLCFGDAAVDYSSSTQRQMDVVPKCGY